MAKMYMAAYQGSRSAVTDVLAKVCMLSDGERVSCAYRMIELLYLESRVR